MIQISVMGGERVRRDLNGLSRTASQLDRVLLKAGEIIRTEIAGRAPRKTGALASSITATLQGRNRVVVFPRGTQYYAGTTEFGGSHRPRRGRRFMAWREGGTWIFAQRVRISRRPYFYPGYEAAKGDAFELVEREIGDWLRR